MIDPLTLGACILLASGGASGACIVKAYRTVRRPEGTAGGVGAALREAHGVPADQAIPADMQELLNKLD